jgi:hypothetical protein
MRPAGRGRSLSRITSRSSGHVLRSRGYVNDALMKSLRIALALSLAGCAGSSPVPEPPPAATEQVPTPLVLRDCGPPPSPLWSELAHVSVPRPGSHEGLDLSLPYGMTLRPASPTSVFDCGPVESVSALARGDLEQCCEQGADASMFSRGCLLPFHCLYRDASGREAHTPTELAAMLAPIDTPARALGMVSLVHPEVAEPEATTRSPFDFAALPGAPPAFEIEPVADGFVVRAPVIASCGCSHHLIRVAFRVGRDGCVERADEPLVPLAHAVAICVD